MCVGDRKDLTVVHGPQTHTARERVRMSEGGEEEVGKRRGADVLQLLVLDADYDDVEEQPENSSLSRSLSQNQRNERNDRPTHRTSSEDWRCAQSFARISRVFCPRTPFPPGPQTRIHSDFLSAFFQLLESTHALTHTHAHHERRRGSGAQIGTAVVSLRATASISSSECSISVTDSMCLSLCIRPPLECICIHSCACGSLWLPCCLREFRAEDGEDGRTEQQSFLFSSAIDHSFSHSSC